MAFGDLSPKTQDVQQGVLRLKTQRRHLSVFAGLSGVLLLTGLLCLLYLEPMIYGFFGLTLELKQLHVPASVLEQWHIPSHRTDSFFMLLSWLGWLILKLTLSFFAAFIVVRFLKKIAFFARHLTSRTLRFVAWCIAFIVLWSGLSYWQHESTREDPYAEWIAYERNINESSIAQSIVEANIANPIAAYLLAQTALLHQPADTAAAIPQVLALVRAEGQDQNFIHYGFQPEQLWTMQQQLYGKSLTPLAQHVDRQAQQAKSLYQLMQYGVWGLNILLAVLFLSTCVLARRMQRRISRIQGYLE